jgi:hypothetical protein
MYSKKINQLATNLNPQNDDLLPIGDAETGQLKTTTFGSVSGITGDGVISGGIVTWTGTGLIFDISACTYILNGVRYTSPFTTKTLAAADPTNPRIDVFAVNTSGQVEVIQGTPASNPIEPEGDTPTTLGLTNVTINAGATTPNGVTKDMIYDENVETWTKTQSVTGSFDYNNTAFAYTGTKSLLVTMSAGFANFTFSKAVAMDISNYKSLSFAIRLNTAWTSNTILTVRFQNGTNNVTNLFQINSTNNVGFNRNLAGQWQLITIPFNNTNLRFTNNAFTAIRIGTQNAAAIYRLDTISLNGGINNPGGGTTTPSNSFGFVNGTTGTASSTTATDTLNVVGSGLITTSATGKTLTIASNQIATGSILGRVTAGTGNIETLTGTQATTLLDVFTSSLKGLAPASGGGTTNFLRADGTWAAPSGGGGMAIGGSITSATAGSVLFAGTSGVLQQDNANFFWDDTNNRLGIGTATPANRLDVIRGTAGTMGRGTYESASFSFNGDMKFGIYTAAAPGSGGASLIFGATNFLAGSVYPGFEFQFVPSATLASNFMRLNYVGRDSSGTVTSSSANLFNVYQGGNVDIGGAGTDPAFKLSVNGTLRVVGNITTNTTLGSVLFAGASGLLSQDNTNFFWDNTNKRLGIGNATPSNPLDVLGDVRSFKNQNAASSIIVSNTTSGTGSQARLVLTSDGSSGSVVIGKYSTTTTPFQFVTSKDFYLYNLSDGDISILNGNGSGKIKFGVGSTSTSHVQILSTGVLEINATMRAGVSGNTMPLATPSARFCSSTTTSQIEVNGNGGAAIYLNDYSRGTDLKYYEILNQSSNFKISRLNDANTVRTEFFTIFTSTGNIGISQLTDAGFKLDINGSSRVQGKLSVTAGTTAASQINLASSTAPTSPNNGDIWFDGTDIKMRIGGVTKTFTLI